MFTIKKKLDYHADIFTPSNKVGTFFLTPGDAVVLEVLAFHPGSEASQFGLIGFSGGKKALSSI